MSKSTACLRAITMTSTMLAGTLAAMPVQADEQRDYLGSEIVVTAVREGYAATDGSSGTKTPTPLIDVPQTVAVITADQIEDQNLRQLGDALRYLPGVSLGTGEGHRDQVILRGQNSTADFFVDGLRDDAQYYRPLYNVERVEVLKGANALIFGRGGGGGAINRVLKSADTMADFFNGAASMDTFGAWNLSADINQPLTDTVAVRLNGTYEELNNSRDAYDGRFFGISPTLTAELGPDTRFTASYTYDDDARVTDRGVPSLGGRPIEGYDTFFFGSESFNHSESQAHIARSRIDHRLADGVSVNATVQYAHYDKYYGNILPGATNGTTVSLSGYESGNTRENLTGQVNLVAQFATGGVEHTLLAGVEAMDQNSTGLRRDVRFSGASSITVPLASFAVPAFTLVANSSSQSDLQTLSAYVQEQLDFGIAQLVAGLRYDRFDLASVNLQNNFAGNRVDEKWSPRLGLIVKPLEAISLYASYATSFLPQSGDQFNVLTPVTELLVPEKFANWELGGKWAITDKLIATAALFRLDRSNTQSPDPNNSGQVLLTGQTRTEGLELSLAGEVTDDLQLTLGYSLLDGEVRTTTSSAPAGRTLQAVPRHQVSAWARYQLTPVFGFGAGVIHQADRFATISNAVTLPAYTRVDAALFYDVAENISLQFNVENLFDADYFPSSHTDNNIQPGEPLNATLGVRLNF